MSGGLFGFTSSTPQTTYNEKEQMKIGAGYNFLRADHEPIYQETKEKFQELYQPIKEINATKELKPFTINDIGNTMQPAYGLNASYYSGLIGNEKEKPYGTEIFIPQSFPNHMYNPQKFSPIFLALK